MTVLDFILIGILVFFAVMGFVRGLASQLFTIAGIVAGFVLAKFFYGKIAEVLGLDVYLGGIAAFLIGFFAVFLCVKLIGLIIEKLLKPAKLSFFNRFCGSLLGVIKGTLICVLLISFMLLVYPRGEEVIAASRSATYFSGVAKSVHRIIPDEIREVFTEQVVGDVNRENESPVSNVDKNTH